MEMPGVQAYLAGLTFALAASPCSTPVLATLLGYVATSRVSVSLFSFLKIFCKLDPIFCIFVTKAKLVGSLDTTDK